MSLIAAAKHKIGTAVDLAKNFIFDASAQDSVLRLFRENNLSTPILSFDANNVMEVPANKIGVGLTISPAYAIPNSEIKLGTVNTSVGSNYGNAWNAGTSRFQPSVAGVYFFSVSASISGGGTVVYLSVRAKKNGLVIAEQAQPPYSSIYGGVNLTNQVYLNGTTDYIEFFAQQGGSTNGQLNGAYITAALLFKA